MWLQWNIWKNGHVAVAVCFEEPRERHSDTLGTRNRESRPLERTETQHLLSSVKLAISHVHSGNRGGQRQNRYNVVWATGVYTYHKMLGNLMEKALRIVHVYREACINGVLLSRDFMS